MNSTLLSLCRSPLRLARRDGRVCSPVGRSHRFPPLLLRHNSSVPHPPSNGGAAFGVSFEGALFPGQGAQAVGMGKDLCSAWPAARRTFDEVDAALGEKLSALAHGSAGDAETLARTANAQPALLAHSIASWRVLEEECPELLADVRGLLGHSVGEFAALVAGGSLSLWDAARAVRARASAMQGAADAWAAVHRSAPLGMQAWILDSSGGAEVFEAVGSALREAALECSPEMRAVASVAAMNAASQVTVSGTLAALDAAAKRLKERSILKRAVPLRVSAPFHCAIMAPAAAALTECLVAFDAGDKEAAAGEIATASLPAQTASPEQSSLCVSMASSRIQLVANCDAALRSSAGELKRSVVECVTAPVLWQKCVERAAADREEFGLRVRSFLELGSGTSLAGLVRSIVDGRGAKSETAAAARTPPSPKAPSQYRVESCGTPADVVRLIKSASAAK